MLRARVPLPDQTSIAGVRTILPRKEHRVSLVPRHYSSNENVS